MKIIHILHELKFSGAEIMYVDAAPIFQKKGCELTVMATGDNLGEFAPYFQRAGYRVIHKPLPDLKYYFRRLNFFYCFIKYIKKEKYNVIHIHSHRAMFGISFCAWVANIKSVYTFHSIFPTRPITYLYHILIRWSAKHLFKCRFQSISDSVFSHELKLYHNKTIKIYNWYGSNRFYPANFEEKENVRKELGINKNAFVFISVGGCSNIKRHSEIIKALHLILKKSPNCLYLHLGNGTLESEEKQLAENLGILGHIKFCGIQEDIRKYLISSDIYIMSSRFEGISITTIEAMACRIPTILYDVPGLRDFNKQGENSILIPDDYKVLAEKILFLQKNPLKLTRVAKRACYFVHNNFNIKSNVYQILDLYKH